MLRRIRQKFALVFIKTDASIVEIENFLYFTRFPNLDIFGAIEDITETFLRLRLAERSLSVVGVLPASILRERCEFYSPGQLLLIKNRALHPRPHILRRFVIFGIIVLRPSVFLPKKERIFI